MECVSTMTDEQLAINTQNGCQVSCTELFNRYTPLLMKLSRDINPSYLSDDLMGHLQIAFVVAVNNFDAEKSAFFKTYIKPVLSHASTDFKRHQQYVYKCDELARHDVVLDEGPTPLDMAMKSIDHTKLHEALDLLPTYEKELLTKLFMEGMDLSHLATWQYHVCCKTLRNHRKRALRMLERQLKKLHLNCIPETIMPAHGPAPIIVFEPPVMPDPVGDNSEEFTLPITA